MDALVTKKLLAINDEFYQTFSRDFSDTRMRLQPGVIKILSSLPTTSNILDLGCGNGELALWLANKRFSGNYIGLDHSKTLLEIARNKLSPNRREENWENQAGDDPFEGRFQFLEADIAQEPWEEQVRERAQSCSMSRLFDFVTAFATFHHFPGKKIQIQTLEKISLLLEENGHLILSNWQFLNSERLRRRIQPWESVDLSQEDVEPGDYLIDWRRGGRGLRYVHHFSEDELYSLASSTGFEVIKTFYSDGKGGNLGLYQVWEKRGQ